MRPEQFQFSLVVSLTHFSFNQLATIANVINDVTYPSLAPTVISNEPYFYIGACPPSLWREVRDLLTSFSEEISQPKNGFEMTGKEKQEDALDHGSWQR